MGSVKYSVVLVILIVVTVATVRNCRQVEAYNDAMTKCIKWAETNVPDVDARAWCEP